MLTTQLFWRRTIHKIAAMSVVLTAVYLPQMTSAADIEKSPNDEREYRAIILDNGLKVTLVHHADTDTAAASMDVATGAGSDPADRAGLAHFLEHMLFLGTEKYPEPGAYSNFIREHGGSNNAYTSYANTNYFFDVEAEHLFPALDMFAQFFIAPLFTEELVQREKNAVHSEYTGKRREDGLRFWSARKMGFNQAHPMSGFTTGNLETLADREGSTIRDELIQFYNTYYSSNIMSLSIIGRESLDELEREVRKLFAAVPNRNATKQKFDIELFDPDQLPSRMNVIPLKEQRHLSMTFPIPQRDEHRFTRPKSYIGNILGHEGTGSLLSALKETGWVSSLSAGSGISIRSAASFDISIGLTESGVDHINDIIGIVFQAINMVRDSGLPTRIYEESQLLDELAFRFQEESAASALVGALATRAQDWPVEKIISGPYRRTHFDVNGITEVLQHMVPENLQLLVVASDLKTNLTTRWYETPYSLEPIPEAVVALWKDAGLNPDISLPVANEFLPRNLDLLEDASGDPVNLINSDKLEVWHRTDTSFRVPRANLNVNIHTPAANRSARSTVLTILYTQLINEQLNEFSYPANLAGLGYSLSHNRRGLGIRISGYADGQRQMLKKLSAAMTTPLFHADDFDRKRKALIEEIENIAKEAPYQQVGTEIRRLITAPYFTAAERIDELNSLTLQDLRAFVPELFQRVKVIVLSHGNVNEAETLKRTAILKTAFVDDAEPADVLGSLVLRLPKEKRFQKKLDIEHNDSSIAVYVQASDRSRASRARYALLRQILSQPFYNDLRTKQQLGYFVFTYGIDIMQVPSVVLSLQSPSTGPARQLQAIEKFLVDFGKELEAMPDDEFERYRQALIAQVEEDHKRLGERTRSFWSAVVREDYIFDATLRFSEKLKQLTKDDIVELYRKLFIDANAGRIVVYNEGNTAQDQDSSPFEDLEYIESISEFKRDKTRLLPLSKLSGIE